MAEIKHKRIWVITEEDGFRVTPTKPKYEGAYTEYIRADLQRPTPEPGDVVERAKKARTAIYIAVEKDVADDINAILGGLLALIQSQKTEIERLEARCEHYFREWQEDRAEIERLEGSEGEEA